MSYKRYRMPPPVPPRPVEPKKKYFYTVLYIKSYLYNIKGQAIIFRRKTLDSLMKLLNDFDETYLHSSYEHSYQNKRLSEGNVDFLIKYTNNLDSVIKLIDQNSYIIKLSWQPQEPVRPAPPFFSPLYDCYYNKSNDAYFRRLRMWIESIAEQIVANVNKRVKITGYDYQNSEVLVREWDEMKKEFVGQEFTVHVDDITIWSVGEVASLINGLYLQKTDISHYKRVKVTDVDNIENGIVYVREFDDRTKTFPETAEEFEVNVTLYCYGDKIPDWHVNDDALLFDNKYLIKLDIPEVYGFNGNGLNGGGPGPNSIAWSHVPGSDAPIDTDIGDTGDPLSPEYGNEFGTGFDEP